MKRLIIFLTVLFMVSPVLAVDEVRYYKSTVLEEPFSEDDQVRIRRSPSIVSGKNLTGWVLLYDGGDTMIIKVLADPSELAKFDSKDNLGKSIGEVMSKSGKHEKVYLKERGEGTIFGR